MASKAKRMKTCWCCEAQKGLLVDLAEVADAPNDARVGLFEDFDVLLVVVFGLASLHVVPHVSKLLLEVAIFFIKFLHRT